MQGRQKKRRCITRLVGSTFCAVGMFLQRVVDFLLTFISCSNMKARMTPEVDSGLKCMSFICQSI